MRKKPKFTTAYKEEAIATITPPSQTRTESEEKRASSIWEYCIESKLEEAERELKKAKKRLKRAQGTLEVIRELKVVQSAYASGFSDVRPKSKFSSIINTINRISERSARWFKKDTQNLSSSDLNALLRYHDPQDPNRYCEFDKYSDQEIREIAWLILAKESNQKRREDELTLYRIYQRENLVLRSGETKTRETLLEEALKSHREAYKNWNKKWLAYLENKGITEEQAYQKIPQKLRDKEI